MDLILNQMMKESTESYDKNPRKLLHMIFRRIELRKAVFVGIAAIQARLNHFRLIFVLVSCSNLVRVIHKMR
jgi:hypothetical protein